MAKRKLTRKRLAKRNGHFAIPTLDTTLASTSAKTRRGAHIIGRPPTDYLLLPSGQAKVDVVADRLASIITTLDKRELGGTLRGAIMSAHDAGSRKLIEFITSDRYTSAKAASRALHALSVLVNDPTFIPAIRHAAPIADAENLTFGNHARELANGLEYVALLEAVLSDAQRHLKPIKRQNPGRPYMAGLAESLVAFWRELTGEFPSKTRIHAERTKSQRASFWYFWDCALTDLGLHDHPIDYQIRAAIDRTLKAARAAPK